MTLPEPTDRSSSDESAGDVEIADAVLDALLEEVLVGQTPPDQSDVILRRLQQPIITSRVSQSGVGSRVSRNRRSTRSQTIPGWKIAAATAATLLVCVGVAVGIQNRNGVEVAENSGVAGNSSEPGAGNGVQSPQDAEARSGKSGGANEQNRSPASPIALADATPDSEPRHRDPLEMLGEQSQPRIEPVPAAKPAVRPLTLVSTSLSKHLNQHWERVGVQPTKLLPPEETAQRLAGRLHVKVGPEAIGDSEAMRSRLATSGNTKSLAGPVLAAISSRPESSLTRPIDKQMMTQVTKSLRQGRGFDRLVASWFREPPKDKGQDNDAPTVSAIGQLLRPLSQHESVVSSASLVLGTDARCIRCHDLPSTGGETADSQQDYWQFAANLSPSLGWQTNAPSGWFYDQLDGRRRLAEADDSMQWSEQLVGSRTLADGLVGAMWKLVYGRPLTSTPYDLSGTAEGSDLRNLRAELTDDLIASDFDLLRTISLITTNSIVGRSTPEAMTPSGLLTASSDEWVHAVTAVESFAAAPPASMPSSRSDRLSLVLNELPSTGSVDPTNALLAQPLGRDDLSIDALRGPKKFLPAELPEPSPAMVAGLPVRATIVMPAWMGKLPDFDSRLEHIANLAGLSDVPEDVKTLASQMREAGVDESLILQRVWWIVRPQG
ncbi:hypothetical protein [Allorhodopirellula solitaria]|uniref:DUF1549 domain-containing protein n=1 Tax=Allorhodopirellula solitaria TaxID=2527987 RepID=A0A5C5YHN6_9BACT|nr:hypothetical protein [Allorhodopirellula solitaria]TWT74391.1 hypothetical protein CA85_12800 [Allorhodopirellula solitaria]